MEALLEKNSFMDRTFVNLSFDELNHFESLARDFCKRSIAPMFEGDLADGDFSYLDMIFKKAFDTGIAASHRADRAGNEYGIWGSGIETSGLLSSLVLLSAVAESCGGIAMALHSQGLASNLLQKAQRLPDLPATRPALCLQDDFGMPAYKTLMAPESDEPQRINTVAVKEGDSYVLNGSKHFVYCIPGTDCFVVLAREASSWCCLAVPAKTPGVTMSDAGRRTGLRACGLYHLAFANVTVPGRWRIDKDNARALALRSICLDMAGMSAIAVGIARGAIKAALQYAAERYQGGRMIENLPVIKNLMAEAKARTHAAKAAVFNQKDMDIEKPSGLRAAAMTKLTALNLCAQAVTDSLQVFGGYGYMEDFGMEKRLRDVTVLKSAHGSPLYLKRLIGDIDREEGPR
jgi:alkylation response protein AidB-like acyl-CoA dehydrogenase